MSSLIPFNKMIMSFTLPHAYDTVSECMHTFQRKHFGPYEFNDVLNVNYYHKH